MKSFNGVYGKYGEVVLAVPMQEENLQIEIMMENVGTFR